MSSGPQKMLLYAPLSCSLPVKFDVIDDDFDGPLLLLNWMTGVVDYSVIKSEMPNVLTDSLTWKTENLENNS